jgi:hypothetical protein
VRLSVWLAGWLQLLRRSKVASGLLTEAYKYQASPAHRRQALMNQRSTQRLTAGTAAPRLMDSLRYTGHMPPPTHAAAGAGAFVQPGTAPAGRLGSGGAGGGGYGLRPGGVAAGVIVPSAGYAQPPPPPSPPPPQPSYASTNPSLGLGNGMASWVHSHRPPGAVATTTPDPRLAAMSAAGAIERARATVQAKKAAAAGAPSSRPQASRTPGAGAPVVGPYVAVGGAGAGSWQ